VKTKPRDWYDMLEGDWYDMLEEDINKVCQENKDIDSISLTFYASDNEHGFSFDRNDLAHTITKEKPMMHMKVIDDDDDMTMTKKVMMQVLI